MTKKIAYLRMGTSLPANVRVGQLLAESFPEYQVDIIDIGNLLKQDRIFTFLNALNVVREYGGEILLKRKKFRQCMMRTSFFFNGVKRLVSRQLARKDYAFSFQIQSLFDGSTSNMPHYVYTDHTHLANLYYKDFDKRKLYSQNWIQLEKTIYQNATKVFTRSSNISRSVIEQYNCPSEKVVCVYAGSNATTCPPQITNKDYSQQNILFVGVDWQRKGGPILLEAFRKVLQAHPKAHLTIVGCHPNVTLSNCKVVGRVSLKEVNDYYKKASIFCMPTNLEPFGIVFVEALTYRLPIVATNIGAVPDLVTDGVNGYLVEPGDVNALANRLCELLADSNRCRTFGQRGYELATERYNWDRVGARFRENILTTSTVLTQT